jgi:hypothetical protein
MAHLLTLLSARFSPLDLPNLALWLDAQDAATVSLAGTSVSQWSDKSGKGNHATQATGAAQPQYGISTINGKPCMDITGTSGGHFLLPNLGVSGAFTVFCVFEDEDSYGFLFGNYDPGSTNDGISLYLTGATPPTFSLTASDGAVDFFALSPQIVNNTPYVGHGRFNGSTIIAGINGAAGVATNFSALNNPGTQFALFKRGPNAGAGSLKKIGEFLFYKTALGTSQIADMAAYLKAKWNIA